MSLDESGAELATSRQKTKQARMYWVGQKVHSSRKNPNKPPGRPNKRIINSRKEKVLHESDPTYHLAQL